MIHLYRKLHFFLWVLLTATSGKSTGAQPVPQPSPLTGAKLQRTADWNFESIGVKEGLPHDSIYAFAQDSSGYLWIGTFGGLSRFDGYHVRNYVHHQGQANSLPDNTVRAILPRRDGDIWLGTENAGLAIYDPHTDRFRVPQGMPAWMNGAHIFSLANDGADGIWVGTQGGMAHYLPAEHRFEIYGREKAGGQSQGLPQGDVYCTLMDREHNLWVGGEKGIFLRHAGSSEFLPVPIKDGTGELGKDAPIWSIFEDSSGSIWIGSDTTGIGVVDKLDRQGWSVRGLPRLSGADSLSGPHTIRGFVEPNPGEIWAATYGGGLIRIDRHAAQERVVKRDLTSPAPLSNDYIRGIFVDRSGVLWVGTNNGVSYTPVRQRRIYNLYSSPLRTAALFGNEVRAVGAGYGKAWVGFDQGGFAQIDSDGSIHRIQPSPGTPEANISKSDVLAITPIAPDKVLASGGGLFLIDVPNRTYRPIAIPELRNTTAKVLCADSDAIWIGTYAGLLRYDQHTRKVRVFVHSSKDRDSLADNNIRDILKRPDGSLWIATRHGLDLFNPATETFHHYRHREGDPASLPSDNLQPLELDSSGRLWIGTVGNGIAVMDNDATSKPVFHTIGASQGLPGVSVITLTAGSNGTMWANTTAGLAAIDTRSGHISVYGSAEGLQRSMQSVFSSAALEDGTILLPTRSSLSIIPTQTPTEPLHGPLQLTELVVSRGALAPDVIAHDISPSGLRLVSHEGFAATFADFDFAATPDITYAYIMEGHDRAWSADDTGDRTATYTNLAPGHYVFRVSAGKRIGEPSVFLSLPVIVTAPFYERTWFRLLAVLFLIMAIYGGIRLRTARLMRREQQLEREVAERTAKLNESQMELISANQRLAEIADHDFLTGILNRRGFFDRAEREIIAHKRSLNVYSILLIDMDNFKKLNDRLGHYAGDEALKSVAMCVTKYVRPTDLFARYGGEEFILFLPNTEGALAYVLAETVRLNIQDLDLTITGERTSLTVSIGLASSEKDAGLKDIISKADENLYLAKQNGRNCTQQ